MVQKMIGGPYNGQKMDFGKYSDLPVIQIPHPNNLTVVPRTIESYELQHGERLHIGSKPFVIQRVIR